MGELSIYEIIMVKEENYDSYTEEYRLITNFINLLIDKKRDLGRYDEA
jgi:hypothetical protein